MTASCNYDLLHSAQSAKCYSNRVSTCLCIIFYMNAGIVNRKRCAVGYFRLLGCQRRSQNVSDFTVNVPNQFRRGKPQVKRCRFSRFYLHIRFGKRNIGCAEVRIELIKLRYKSRPKVLFFALLSNFRRKSALTGTGFLAVLFWRTMHVFLKSTVKITDIAVTTADCNAADGSNGS